MINFKFIGWNNKEGHDKVWTSFEIDGQYYCAWGRRNAKLQFKNHGTNKWKMQTIAHDKQGKGYKEVDKFLLFSIFPDFEEKVEQELMMATLSGKVI